MLRTLTLLAAGASSAALFAQQITGANMPVVGDVVDIGIMDSMLDPGASGTGQTWDFSAATATSTGSFSFVEVAGSLFEGRFPGADLCGISWEGSYAYYDLDNDVLSQVGFGTLVAQAPPNDTALVLYSDPETVVELPFEFGATFTDAIAGDDIAFNIPFAFTGQVMVEADGTGTLITPAGTFTNVVRYHLTGTKVGATTTTRDQYVWMSPAHRFWLMLTETVSTAGFPSGLTWWATDPISASVGVDEPKRTDLRLMNTLVDRGTLTLVTNEAMRADLRIHDLTGKLVRGTQREVLSGYTTINVSDLSKGVYLIQVRSKQGTYAERFVVQ